jgi:hypothetical protein
VGKRDALIFPEDAEGLIEAGPDGGPISPTCCVGVEGLVLVLAEEVVAVVAGVAVAAVVAVVVENAPEGMPVDLRAGNRLALGMPLAAGIPLALGIPVAAGIPLVPGIPLGFLMPEAADDFGVGLFGSMLALIQLAVLLFVFSFIFSYKNSEMVFREM